MASRFHPPAVLLAGLVLLAGCASPPAAPRETLRATPAFGDRLELVGLGTADSVSCSGLQPRELPDGRLEVVASVVNRSDERVRVAVSCVFKDAQGGPVGIETPRQTLALKPGATEAITFTAPSVVAKKYTVRVHELP